MFHALVRAAKDFWLAYRRDKKPWEPATATEWREFLAKIAGKDPNTRQDVMARSNPAWVGKIVMEKYGPNGPIGTKISNTRETRDAAYEYVLSLSSASSFLRRPDRRAA
jgi:hypothetical protein